MEWVRAMGVVKRFGATLALRGLDATFERGLTVVEGANGSGKSTLLGIIGGVIRATSGKVEFGGSQRGLRGDIGWVSHETLAYADLTAKENLVLAARLHGLDAGRAWEGARTRFGLESFGDRRLRTYSRGQRQRLALARALVHQPEVLLLDEPSTGLDADGVTRLLDVVRVEIGRGAIVLLVTHEPEVFSSLGGARLRIQRGRAVD